ncbi:MAG: division/cell wall cluster transcriptional repressor MraZ [Candidatus Delongbacteria bacterium]|nr:division/cell wall cluster transcriptional repressor MraZ [Candidatus Delongbacteria bacterium]
MFEFNGTYYNSIDPKGRIAIPVKLRKSINDNTVVITRGLDKCLYLYPNPSWQEQLGNLSKLPQSNPKVRQLRIFMVGNADTVDLDKQGRILINTSFLEFLNLNDHEKNRVTFVGDINKILIWNPSEYEQYMAAANQSMENLSQEFDFEF